ncbi:hypothetical protein FGO68_gene7901 [Halteria grandinella]|uniref:Uncharacterized protein n=1 Tax=Halteria grandinella TaxID=5974 RepID=A0A8J8T560_HALGN|nr:hypothetical protein FGO68_gene7901 [Halteria grandinella]
MLIHSHTDIFIIIQKHIMEAAHHTTGWQLGKVNRSGPLFELLSYSGYYGDVIPSQIALLNGKLRKLTIRHYKVIKMVMKRPTFQVSSISQLLSPLLMCHSLKIELDKNDKQDILDLLAYIDSQRNRVIKLCSIQVPYQAWNEGLKKYENEHKTQILERIQVESFTLLECTKAKTFSLLPKVTQHIKICEKNMSNWGEQHKQYQFEAISVEYLELQIHSVEFLKQNLNAIRPLRRLRMHQVFMQTPLIREAQKVLQSMSPPLNSELEVQFHFFVICPVEWESYKNFTLFQNKSISASQAGNYLLNPDITKALFIEEGQSIQFNFNNENQFYQKLEVFPSFQAANFQFNMAQISNQYKEKFEGKVAEGMRNSLTSAAIECDSQYFIGHLVDMILVTFPNLKKLDVIETNDSRSIKSSLQMPQIPLEEIILTYPCHANTDIYCELIKKCLPTLRKLSISLEKKNYSLGSYLKELISHPFILRVLKLNYSFITIDNVVMLQKFTNLTVITGLDLDDFIEANDLESMLRALKYLKKLKISCKQIHIPCFYIKHESLMKLKIESEDAKITPEDICQISLHKPKGFSLRIHAKLCAYKYEELIEITSKCRNAYFNVPIVKSILDTEETFRILNKQSNGHNLYRIQGLQLIKSLKSIKEIVSQNDIAAKLLIKEYLRQNLATVEGTRKVLDKLIQLPQSVLEALLTDFELLLRVVERGKLESSQSQLM